jgi:hypothetical protein
MPLDASTFRSRLRDALRGPGGGTGLPATPSYASDDLPRRPVDRIAADLGGEWARGRGGACLVIDHEYGVASWHGDSPVHDFGEAIARYATGLSTLSAAWRPAGTAAAGGAADAVQPAMPGLGPWDAASGRLLFFDLETTGLSGGAGTYAFLVGCGWFEDGAFHTRQFFLAEQDDERQLLAEIGRVLEGRDGLVTFNGKTFDLPLIEMRYQLHREPCPFELPHLDLLHPARRLWRRRRVDPYECVMRRDGGGVDFGRPGEEASCALNALEAAILRFHRHGDVPGAEIPSRYFRFLRGGDARLLAPVLEHNRLDLLSLAALTGTVLRVVAEGPPATRDIRECLGLGRLYDRAGEMDRATACYRHAAAPEHGTGLDGEDAVRADALRLLAIRYRRARRFAEAADAWARMLELTLPAARGEAAEALAIHHEHRSRDLESARAFAMRALEAEDDPDRRGSVEFRLARLDRKLRTLWGS